MVEGLVKLILKSIRPRVSAFSYFYFLYNLVNLRPQHILT